MKTLAFYLPQFHPIPENDRWWGKGFTEWTNVAKARPQYRGHYQPHLPSDLGFYDLRVPEVREAQALLAKEYGIDGFCYYHYWFGGQRLLERPFNEVLATGSPDLPFCLCWANESWSRRWDGSDRELLAPQTYSAEDDLAHCRWLLSAFKDPRYIRIEGKPLFLIYRAGLLPDPGMTARRWREAAAAAGLPGLYLVQVEYAELSGDAARIGFDSSLEFQPFGQAFGAAKLKRFRWWERGKLGTGKSVFRNHSVLSYEKLVEAALQQAAPPYKRFPSVCPAWDNTARRQKGAVIIDGSTPALFERWLTGTLAAEEKRPVDHPDEHIVFINAWNEWAEGNHLEPCHRDGRGYLEAVRNARQAVR